MPKLKSSAGPTPSASPTLAKKSKAPKKKAKPGKKPTGDKVVKKKAKKKKRRKIGYGKKLVIVESAAKAKTIGKYLGRKYRVVSCMGHLIDLPKSEMGVDVNNDFMPKYITIRGKGKILQELRKEAKKSSEIYTATDPDREGEAIGWHLEKHLRNLTKGAMHRVSFNEVTPKAVRLALENPRPVNVQMVEAQQARRVLDRLVGYTISPILWTTIRRGLSAGRVQSVALKIVHDRESIIKAFVAKEYWQVEGRFRAKEGAEFSASLDSMDGKDLDLGSKAVTQDAIEKMEASQPSVLKVTRQTRLRNPAAPLTTSKLQQMASSRLRMNLRRVMQVAQQLYEGIDVPGEGLVGLITYMRTDSRRVSEDAQEETRKFVTEKYGAEALPASPPVYKNKSGAQDAHEAIRPTSVLRTPEDLADHMDQDQQKLYQLIWQVFVASQMKPAKYQAMSLQVAYGPGRFRASFRILEEPGWLQAIPESGKEEEPMPQIEEGTELTCVGLDKEQRFTEPPPRYTEASLVKELEENGIGRPSTYAPTVGILQARGYMRREQGGRLTPTELGTMVNGILTMYFAKVVDIGFTAKMEEDLDAIESGKNSSLNLLRMFYESFREIAEKAKDKAESLRAELQHTDEVCDICGKPLLVKWSRFGKFMGCCAYPDCHYTKALEQDEEETIDVSDRKCEKCGQGIKIKRGRFGAFLSCENYPECDFTASMPIGVPCPEDECSGELVTRGTKRGRKFFSCDRYPECEFRSWQKPVAQKCEHCESPYMVIRIKAGDEMILCPKKGCDGSKPPSENEFDETQAVGSAQDSDA